LIQSHRMQLPRRILTAALLGLGAVLALALLASEGQAKAKPRGTAVNVMTRNVYLGADLGPAIAANNPNQFSKANGQILRDVDTNNFPTRARGLASEIRGKKPDLVGLQEVALWRTNDTASLGPAVGGPFTATTVKYDYLKLLMDRLNAGKKRYRIVKVQKEFDFEAPADYNNQPNDADPGVAGVMPDAEMNGRLTMRDVILARTGAGVITKNAKGGNFKTTYKPVISGVTVNVNRGWAQADVTVRGSRKFRFVDTHLEAFGDTDIRKAQAQELVARGGPATGKLPVVLVGDLNSDDNTVQNNGDRDAFDAIKAKGFVDRSTENPMSCCLKTDILTADKGALRDFDHHIDHVLTNRPQKVKGISSSVTGLAPVNGYWDSDHAGVFSALKMLR
jgi:endonuclease/exonuclease/phosphatase family metal-dependent hydrolase